MNDLLTFSRPGALALGAFCLLSLSLSTRALGDDAPPQGASPGAWVAHHITVPAAQVVIGHLGVHTHANFLRFDTGTVNVGRMQADSGAQHYRRVRVVGRCRLPTDRAALPPGFEAFQTNVGPIPTVGPIEGPPGWSLSISHQHGHNGARIAVPTRFANWVAAQPETLRRRYRDPHSYFLDIQWDEWGGG